MPDKGFNDFPINSGNDVIVKISLKNSRVSTITVKLEDDVLIEQSKENPLTFQVPFSPSIVAKRLKFFVTTVLDSIPHNNEVAVLSFTCGSASADFPVVAQDILDNTYSFEEEVKLYT